MKSKNLCNFCNSNLKQEVIDLGKTPLANSYSEKPLKLNKYKLQVFFCSKCYLVQHSTKLKGEKIFSNYQYFSSYSKEFVKLARENIFNLIKKYKIKNKNTVIEIASNDGYLLKHVKEKKINYYGIEPAKNIALAANKKKITTINKYLNTKNSIEILKKFKKGDLIIANNVFAHVPDIHDFVKSIYNLMNERCIVCIEVPHIKKLIQYNQFDTIYHEHFYYFSLSSIKNIFEKYDMKIIHVDRIKTHGGSLRVHLSKKNNKIQINKIVNKILIEEKIFGLTNNFKYDEYNKKINILKKNIKDFFNRNNDKVIYGFGAAAKACTLINFCDLNLNSIKYMYDETPAKIGKYIPGTDIKIVKFSNRVNKKIDIIVIFPWNHYKEIKDKIKKVTTKKIKLVRLIPKIQTEIIN